MIVVWTKNATRELRAIHDYIAQNSRKYAQGMVNRIRDGPNPFADFPLLGPKVPEYEDESIRELYEHPYRIIYRVREERIEVLSVVHGARSLSTDLPESPG
jgi:addiction module RelE/StbE family toxin